MVNLMSRREAKLKYAEIFLEKEIASIEKLGARNHKIKIVEKGTFLAVITFCKMSRREVIHQGFIKGDN